MGKKYLSFKKQISKMVEYFHERAKSYFNRKVGDFWGDRAAGCYNTDIPINWLCSPLIVKYCVNPLISGHSDKDWVHWVKEEFFPTPADYGLGLGCSSGILERRAISLGICKRFDAFDISVKAIEVATVLAAREGISTINYHVQDVNYIKLDKDKYDVVLSDQSVHHFERLEHIFNQVHESLKPNGLFIMDEFVGPNRFQWTNRQLKITNELLKQIPKRYKRNFDPNPIKRFLTPYKNHMRRRPIWRMKQVDPSEAIRSVDILPLVYKYFEVVKCIEYGGTILQLFFDRIAGNFQENPEDLAIIRNIFDLERQLIEKSELPSDFALIVAKPKG